MTIKNMSLPVLAVIAIAAIALLGVSGTLFAQTSAVSCNPPSPSITVGQAQTFTAAGGNGIYAWSGQNLNVTNPTGVQFTVSYPTPGMYTITVSSNGQSANCTLNVMAATGGTTPTSTTPGLPDTGEGYFFN